MSMRAHEDGTGCYFIEREGHDTLRVAPPNVHNFRIERAVMRRDENERWRLCGVVLGGDPKNDPDGFEAAVLKADIAWDNFLLMHPDLHLDNRTWVLNLTVTNLDEDAAMSHADKLRLALAHIERFFETDDIDWPDVETVFDVAKPLLTAALDRCCKGCGAHVAAMWRPGPGYRHPLKALVCSYDCAVKTGWNPEEER